MPFIRDVVREISRDAEYLAEMKIEAFTTDWTPCTGMYLNNINIYKLDNIYCPSLHEGDEADP